MDHYEYNLLNWQAAPVQHIETRNDREDEEERFRRNDRYRLLQDIRYSDRQDNYDWDWNDRSLDYNSNRYDRNYSPDYNRRRDDQWGDYVDSDRHRQGYQNNRCNNKKRNARKEERRELAKDYQREPDRNITGAQSEPRRIEEPNRAVFGFQPSNTTKAESSNTRKVYCCYCRQDGHYNSQCPVKNNKKRPAVNMVIAEVANIQ